jgi:antitoxin HicB
VLQVVQSLGKIEFTLPDVYAHAGALAKLHPTTPTSATKSASNSKSSATSASYNSSAPAPTVYDELRGRARYLHTPFPSATINHMTTRDFKVFLEPDDDYGGYVVVCPSIPGCYSQGKTVPEALANIREAIDLCIEDMESRGEEIPDPNNVLIGSVVVTR